MEEIEQLEHEKAEITNELARNKENNREVVCANSAALPCDHVEFQMCELNEYMMKFEDEVR